MWFEHIELHKEREAVVKDTPSGLRMNYSRGEILSQPHAHECHIAYIQQFYNGLIEFMKSQDCIFFDLFFFCLASVY